VLLRELADLEGSQPGAKSLVLTSWGRLARLVADALQVGIRVGIIIRLFVLRYVIHLIIKGCGVRLWPSGPAGVPCGRCRWLRVGVWGCGIIIGGAVGGRGGAKAGPRLYIP
jgi:hypothetical protein